MAEVKDLTFPPHPSLPIRFRQKCCFNSSCIFLSITVYCAKDCWFSYCCVFLSDVVIVTAFSPLVLSLAGPPQELYGALSELAWISTYPGSAPIPPSAQCHTFTERSSSGAQPHPHPPTDPGRGTSDSDVIFPSSWEFPLP